MLLEVVGSTVIGGIVIVAARPVPEVRKHLKGKGWQGYPVSLLAFYWASLWLMLNLVQGDLGPAMINGCAALINIGTMSYMLGRTQKEIDRQLDLRHQEYQRELDNEGSW